jgi:mRNA deadenylase 3'-5' endonuclease subunit Ccr4
MSSSSSTSSSASRIRIATYNVLSTNLCSKEYFEHCDPKAVQNNNRWELVKEKILERASSNTIICLQEVSLSWTCRLHKLFNELDYQFIPANYGSTFNGYMGVAIAFPRSVFEVVDCEMVRVADTKSGGFAPKEWKKRDDPPSITTALSTVWSAVAAWLPSRASIGEKVEKVVDPWNESERRHNRMVMVKLQVKDSPNNEGDEEAVAPKAFAVGVYQ